MEKLEAGRPTEVGDLIVIETCFGKTKFKVTRITKNLSLSIRDSDGFEYRFKRSVSHDMAHPKIRWNLTKYAVYRGE